MPPPPKEDKNARAEDNPPSPYGYSLQRETKLHNQHNSKYLIYMI
jgi:hypothetical protein